MPKQILAKLINKYIPDRNVLIQHKHLRFLGNRLNDPNLWHLNRRSISMAFAVGLICAWIPLPMQMVIAAVAALYYRANLPVAVTLVWFTNPITIPPLFYFAYKTGLWFLGRPAPTDSFRFSLEGVMDGLGNAWEPFLLGCFILGICSSAAGYFGINYLWTRHVFKKWAERQSKKSEA
ncbi:DUF2062 domain-containing protein [Methylosoma difficile]